MIPLPFFVIAGPTAVGKSELAVEVAERCHGEIISADAFQVYDGLPVLTAQPSASLRARAAHHLVGEVPLTQRFDVAQFVALAQERCAQIQARGKIPIVCGGSGLYLRALTRGLAALPHADPALRAELEAQPLPLLLERLQVLDPVCADQIDRQNPRRVIRALEVCLLTGLPFSSARATWDRPPGEQHGIFLTRDHPELYARIAQRTERMFAEGVEDEVRRLGEVGETAGQTLGLREIRALLAGTLPRTECLAAIEQATRRYAKRQGTWFRRETALQTVNLSALPDHEALLAQCAEAVRRLQATGGD